MATLLRRIGGFCDLAETAPASSCPDSAKLLTLQNNREDMK